jgi:cytidylate kinase
MRKRGVIAVDGPVGVGKSTVARLLAQQLSFVHIDSGALYRAVAWLVRKRGIDSTDQHAIALLSAQLPIQFVSCQGQQHIYLGSECVTKQLREEEIGHLASTLARFPGVRTALVQKLRDLGQGEGVVMDGRDIGTVVFPEAAVKFYLDASLEERGRRRYKELRAAGKPVELATVMAEMQTRDQQDSERAVAPLRKAADAVLIDTTKLSIDEVLQIMLEQVRSCMQDLEEQ